MSRKQQQYVESAQYVEEPMIGPETDGIRYCLKCKRAILAGEHWRKVTRLGRGGLSVGVHDGCYLSGPAGGQQAASSV